MPSEQSIAVSIALRDIPQDSSIGRMLHSLLGPLTIFQSLLHGSDSEVERQRGDQLFGDR
jgi:hypothetical protein